MATATGAEVQNFLAAGNESYRIRNVRAEHRIRLPKEYPQCTYLKPPRVSVCPACGFKAKVKGSNPLGRVNDFKIIAIVGRRAELRLSAECPRNLFCARSGPWFTDDPPTSEAFDLPFKQAEEFALRALKLARLGVAMFVRVQFLESVKQHNTLFHDNRPDRIGQFTEHVSLVKGRLAPKSSAGPLTAGSLGLRTGRLAGPPSAG